MVATLFRWLLPSQVFTRKAYIYYAMDGKGHEYPISDAFNSSNEIWDFVKQYTLDDVCDTTLKWHPNLQMQQQDVVPAGWATVVDGKSVAGSTVVNSGPRIVAFGAGSDFQHGFLLQSGTKTGYVAYGLDKQHTLQLQPGHYKINLDVIASNAQSAGKTLTVQLVNRNNISDTCSYAVQPQNFIQGTMAKNFTQASFDFTNKSFGEYQLRLLMPVGTAEFIVTNLGVYSSSDNNTGIKTVENTTIGVNELVDIYTINGNLISSNKNKFDSLHSLNRGVYVVSSCERNKVTKVVK